MTGQPYRVGDKGPEIFIPRGFTRTITRQTRNPHWLWLRKRTLRWTIRFGERHDG